VSGAPEPARVLALAGPTASGKSAAALAIAHALAPARVEIVSVDSALVYRGMDIGTAKPSPEDRARVPHHLIDMLDPADAYSAARFVVDARAALEAVRARGAIALLVGGTMLYFKALLDGLDDLPQADAPVRAALEARAAREGWPALHAELARVDPAGAARLAPQDGQRIQRALEVWQLTGEPISAHWSASRSGLELPLISLEPDDRSWLHARIAARLHAMLEAGFIEEVRGLHARGDLHAGLPSMRAVGYRQAWAALDAAASRSAGLRAADAPLDEAARAHLEASAVAATRRLAKRQLTWLRAMPRRLRVPADAADAEARVVALARAHLSAPGP
jgi:tRNA dimethylallyltransferase